MVPIERTAVPARTACFQLLFCCKRKKENNEWLNIESQGEIVDRSPNISSQKFSLAQSMAFVLKETRKLKSDNQCFIK